MTISMILFVGNLGNGSKKGPLGGQNIRTRSILTLLRNDCSERIVVADLSKNIILQSFVVLFGFLVCKKVILLPGKNFVRLLAHLRFFITRKTIFMVAIGGWLHELCDRYDAKSLLMSLECLWVQTEGLKRELRKFEIDSEILPNFKYIDKVVTTKKRNGILDVVFCSRICPEKGILYAIDAFKDLPKTYHLHIYGPTHNFEINDHIKHGNNITYHGEIVSSRVPLVMAKHDVFLFPTFFEGEGFPGVILDAFYAGIPVIASDWKYNAELVTSDVGVLIPIKSSESITEALKLMSSDTSNLGLMAHNSYLKGKLFFPENVSRNFMNKIMEIS